MWLYILSFKIFISFFCSNGNGTSGSGENPFGPGVDDEEWDDGHIDPLVDNGEPGVKVRALYDYEAAESDELDFKAGRVHWYFSLFIPLKKCEKNSRKNWKTFLSY